MDFFISCDSSLVTWLNRSPLVLTIFPSLYLISFLSSWKNYVASVLQRQQPSVVQCLAHSSLSSLTPFLETMGLWYLMSWSVSTKP